MPARTRLTTLQLALVRAIQGGHIADYETLSRATDLPIKRVAQLLFSAKRAAIISYKRDGGRVVVPSLEVTGRGAALLAATEVAAPAPTPRKAAAKAAKATKTKPAKAAPAATHGAGDGLAESISVTYSPDEIEALGEISDKLAALVAVLRAQPKLGPKGAAAMNLIAQLMAGA